MQFKIEFVPIQYGLDIQNAIPIINPISTLINILNDDDIIARFIDESGDNLDSNTASIYRAYCNRYNIIAFNYKINGYSIAKDTERLIQLVVHSDNYKVRRIIKRINLEDTLKGVK